VDFLTVSVLLVATWLHFIATAGENVENTVLDE
jgi:hypothetical protein